MNQNVILKQSSKQGEMHMATIVVVGVVVYLLVFFFINSLGNALGIDLDVLRRFGGFIVLAFVAIGIFGTWKRGNSSSYTLTPDGLVIQRKRGIMGGSSRKVYPYRHITSLEVHQTMMGASGGYGSLYVNMDRLDQPERLELDNLVDPEGALALVQEFMKTNASLPVS